MDQVLRRTIIDELRRSQPAELFGALKRRCAAAEEKAARLEELAARQIDEKVGWAKELVRWQDTVKLRDEAIERKEKELSGALRKVFTLRAAIGLGANEATEDLTLPSGKTLRDVVRNEVAARRRAQEERDLANKRAVEDESTIAELANEVARLQAECDRLGQRDPGYEKTIELLRKDRDRLREELQSLTDRYGEMKGARVHWENRADALAEERDAALRELEKSRQAPAEPNPHHQEKVGITLTLGELAEFVRLFKPALHE